VFWVGRDDHLMVVRAGCAHDKRGQVARSNANANFPNPRNCKSARASCSTPTRVPSHVAKHLDSPAPRQPPGISHQHRVKRSSAAPLLLSGHRIRARTKQPAPAAAACCKLVASLPASRAPATAVPRPPLDRVAAALGCPLWRPRTCCLPGCRHCALLQLSISRPSPSCCGCRLRHSHGPMAA
jgi:hypothetical protein